MNKKHDKCIIYVIVIVIVSYMSSLWELVTFNLQSKWVLEDEQDSAFEVETANLVEYGNNCFDHR